MKTGTKRKKEGGKMEAKNLKIAFIGAGRVAFSLGRYFAENGLNLLGYYSRNNKNAEEAARFTNSESFCSIKEIVEAGDVIFITTSDGAIKEVADEIFALGDKYEKEHEGISIKNKIFCHCSGAMSGAVFTNLEEAGAFGYSIHPMFAFNDKQTSFKELSKAYFTIEGNKEKIDVIKGMFDILGNNYQLIDAKNKTLYHAAAVMASNLVIALYSMAADTLKKCGFAEEDAIKALVPLFINNALNLEKTSPQKALTGPVDRADYKTVEKHLAELDGDYKEVYIKLSNRLVEIAKDKRLEDGSLTKEASENYQKIIDLLNIEPTAQ